MGLRRVLTIVGVGVTFLVAGAVGAPAATLANPVGASPADTQYVPNIYSGVSAASADDVWAVGNTVDDEDVAHALIKHWNGQRWTRTPGPDVSDRADLYLNDVAAIAPDDAWAVGDRLNEGASLVARWNGTSWRLVASPQPGTYTSLQSVFATSATDVWAAGSYGPSKIAAERPLLLHWDGQSWQRVPDDSHGVGYSARAYGVTATGPSDAWMVGVSQKHSYSSAQTFVEHWDGVAWTRVKSPNPSGGNNYLEAVSASSPTDVWAVGWFDGFLSSTKPLSMHWDGQRWQRVLMQHRRRPVVYVHAISAEVPSQVWAVGQKFYAGGNGYRSAAQRWDGDHWQTYRSENPAGFQQTVLRAVSFASEADGWAVGNYDKVGGRVVPLIERWDGTRWNRVDEGG